MIEIMLETPIKHGEEVIEVLELQEPCLKHMKAMDKVTGENAKVIKLVSELAALPPSVIEQITLKDMAQNINPVITDFLPQSQETGEK